MPLPENSSKAAKKVIDLERRASKDDVTKLKKQTTPKSTVERRKSGDVTKDVNKPARRRSSSHDVAQTTANAKKQQPPPSPRQSESEQVFPMEMPLKPSKTPSRSAPVVPPAATSSSAGAGVLDINAMINSFISSSSNIEVIREKEKPPAQHPSKNRLKTPVKTYSKTPVKAPAKTPAEEPDECVTLSSDEDAPSIARQPVGTPQKKTTAEKVSQLQSRDDPLEDEMPADDLTADLSALDALESATRTALSAEPVSGSADKYHGGATQKSAAIENEVQSEKKTEASKEET